MLNQLYIESLFYKILAALAVGFAISFAWPPLLIVFKILTILFFLTAIGTYLMLRKMEKDILLERNVVEKLSLGDIQDVHYTLENNNKYKLELTVYDELPQQLEHREDIKHVTLLGGEEDTFDFQIYPIHRGIYQFGKSYVFISFAKFPLFSWRKAFDQEYTARVYPSVLQMRRYELQVFSQNSSLAGIRRVRELGENDEFEHIREYVQGDNVKSINWKATSKSSQLMVNQYQNSRAQNVYCIIDKGRSMKMPFDNLSLLDHAINSVLVISNIVLKKYDKVGLVTFSDLIGALVKSESRSGQLELIAEKLYSQKSDFKESHFGLLYQVMRRQLGQRSILLFYTNFEHKDDLTRKINYLKALGRKHLLVVILFINTQIEETAEMDCKSTEDIYVRTMASRYMYEKRAIARLLKRNGIQVILTKPQDLSINVINKYLEIKNKRML